MTVSVNRAADYPFAFVLFNWNRFAGNHRFIDGTLALDHRAVGRNFLTRTNTKISRPHFIERDIFITASDFNRRAVFGASRSRALIAAPVRLLAFNSRPGPAGPG